MDSIVKFSCEYNPGGGRKGSAKSCGDMFLVGLIMAAFLIVGVAVKFIPIILFTLLYSVFAIMSFMKAGQKQFVQVTPNMLQVVRADGRILKQYTLKDIKGIYASDMNTVKLMVYSAAYRANVEETLRYVEDINGLIAAVNKWSSMRTPGAQMIPEVPPQRSVMPQLPAVNPNQAQPHVLTEDEADTLHAAQHLLQQGMISQKQYSGMLVPQVPDRVPAADPDINVQNAADYMRRQEMLTQQLGAAPQSSPAEKEKEQYGRSDFV